MQIPRHKMSNLRNTVSLIMPSVMYPLKIKRKREQLVVSRTATGRLEKNKISDKTHGITVF